MHITKRTGKLESPIARCRDTLKGHELTLAHPSHDRPQTMTRPDSWSRCSRPCHDNFKIFSSSSTSTTGSYPVSPSLVFLSNPPPVFADATVGEDGSEETGDGAEDGDSPHASMCGSLDGLEPHEPHQ